MAGIVDRGDAGAVGVVAAGCEGADPAVVHAGAGGGLGGPVPGRAARAPSGARPAGCGRRRRAIPGPWRQQAILGRGRWDADALRDIVRDYALETLADPDAVLVIDETGFLKQGKASCGVARQYTGSAGKITNCQIGVFAAYVSRHGHAFIDRALYLPKAWTDDPARLAAAHVPRRRWASRPSRGLALAHDRAGDRGRACRSAWVAADSVYGVGEIEMALRRAGKGYVLGVNGTHHVQLLGRQAARSPARPRRSPRRCPPSAWRAPVGRRGNQGRRGCTTGPISNWPTSRPPSTTTAYSGLWTRGLLIRRNIADGELAFFTTWCPAGTADRDPGRGRRATAGRSRTASRPPRTSSGSTTTRPAPGMAGIATSRWSCWPSPCWPRSATAPTRRTPQKTRSGSTSEAARPDPLVGPGNPPHRHPAGAATHPARPRHRMVALATSPSGRRTTRAPETPSRRPDVPTTQGRPPTSNKEPTREKPTVMLGSKPNQPVEARQVF